MYIGRSDASAPTNFFTYDMVGGAAWGNGAAIGTVDAGSAYSHRDLNALAYNPRDNYLYAPKRVLEVDPGNNQLRVGLYRLGKNAAGQVEPVVMRPSATGADVLRHSLRIAGLPTTGNVFGAAASFDRLGNYFMVNGVTSDVYLIPDLHEAQPDGPAVQAEKLDRLAETEAAWLADGFEAVAPAHRMITDFAVSPKESANAQPVLYGMGDKAGGKWYLHRYRVDLAAKKVYVSRKEITGMDEATNYMASTAFRRDGKLFLYSQNGKVYEVDADPGSATKWTVIGAVMNATAANASDGASCMTSITAKNDGDGSTPFMNVPNGAEQESPTSVLANDTAYLQPIALSGPEQNATVTPNSWQPAGGGAGPSAGSVTLDPATGKVTVAQGTTPGTYTYEYQICVAPAVAPAGSACDKAQAVIKVTEEPIVAEDDAFGAVGPSAAPLAPSVVANDKVAGVQAVVTGTSPNAQLPAGSWTKISGPAGALIFDYGTGQVTVPVGTPHGDYQYSYQLCTRTGVPPEKCDPAQVTLKVVVVDAVDNDFGEVSAATTATTLAPSIYGNDTVNGVAADASNAAFKAGSWSRVAAPAGGSLTLDEATGVVTVPAGAPAGDYTYSYEICAQPGGKLCDTAQVRLKVKSPAPAVPVVKAEDNAFGEVVAGSSTASVFANDTVDGALAVFTGPGKNAELKAGSWTAGAGNPAGGKLTLNANGTVSVPADAPAGDYTYTYEICAHPAGAPCDAATVTLKVKPAPILAVDNHLGSIAAGSHTVSIFANDLINGQTMQPGVNAKLKPASWKKLSGPAGGDLSLRDDGTVVVVPGTPAGAYEYSYEICVLPGGAPCAVAKVTLTVTAAGLIGAGVTPVPVGAPWALLLAALGIVGLGRRFAS
ncbi:hypothetical protein EBQ34_11195 [Vandammella animalimorsus]|uniref:Uncharacterized protein n=1 Tax=Vandammella animalimorsus TaxID=2029117 RepID=A0A3M6R6N3_9BURK|nr:Ig-like domain-containing protein [Vandammella animalimorsus]RMX10997.1 hypothetical protein EBQ34_11195 [Vandammella animalimorsus]